MIQEHSKKRKSKDYATVKLPDPEDKPHPSWSVDQRRGYLFHKAVELGGTRLINRTAMASLFEKSISMITYDCRALDAYVVQGLSPEKVKSTVQTAFDKAYMKLQEEEKHVEAYHLALSHVSYLQRIGVVKQQTTELDLSGPLQIVIQRKETDQTGGED